MSSETYTNLISCVCLMAVAVLMAILLPPKLHGDAWEYTLVAEAFINHQTPNVTAEDINSHQRDAAMPLHLYDMLKAHIEKHEEPRGGLGFFRGENGNYNSWHFWLYALTNVPAKYTLKQLDMKTDRHFQITNALYLCFLLPYLLLYSRQSMLYKHAVLLLTLLCGGLYYFTYTNPEIFIAVLILLAFTAMLDGRYVQGMIFAAIVGMQNTSFAPTLGFIAIFDLLHRYRLSREIGMRRVLKKAVPVYIGIALLVSIPFIFNLITFKKLTPLEGVVEFGYINTLRFHSLFLDLSQGMIVGYGPVLIATPLLVLARLFAILRKRDFSLDNLIEGRAHILLIVPFVYAIPLVTNINWNSGLIYVMRYAFMAGIPFLIWTSREWVHVGPRLRATTAVPCIAFLAMWNFYPVLVENGVNRGDERDFPPQARLVLNNYPEYYNPDPQIFAKRMRMAYSDQPLQYKNRKGEITKVLIRPKKFENKLYIRKADDAELTLDDAVHISDPRLGEWLYLNGPLIEGFTWGEAALLKHRGRHSGILYDNWRLNALDARMWTTAADPDSEIRMHVQPTTEDHTIFMELENKYGAPITIELLVDQREAARWELPAKTKATYTAPLDPTLTNDGRLNIILRNRSQMESDTIITTGVIAATALWIKLTEIPDPVEAEQEEPAADADEQAEETETEGEQAPAEDSATSEPEPEVVPAEKPAPDAEATQPNDESLESPEPPDDE